MIDEGVTRCLVCRHLQIVLRVLADSRVLCGAREWPRVAVSARTSLAWCRGYPADRANQPPTLAGPASVRP